MNDTNFENNAEINSVHSEAKAQGHGGLKAMAIFFAITTLALGCGLAYVYTSKNKDTKKLNEELVESKEKVKSANESIAKYEEATQTKITDVKQDNVTVKEIVKPMVYDAQIEKLYDIMKSTTYTKDPFNGEPDQDGHHIIESWREPYFREIFTSTDGKYLVAHMSPMAIGVYKDRYNQDAQKLLTAGGYYSYWYLNIATGEWKVGMEGQAAPGCNAIPGEFKTIIHNLNDYNEKNGSSKKTLVCADEKYNNVRI